MSFNSLEKYKQKLKYVENQIKLYNENIEAITRELKKLLNKYGLDWIDPITEINHPLFMYLQQLLKHRFFIHNLIKDPTISFLKDYIDSETGGE